MKLNDLRNEFSARKELRKVVEEAPKRGTRKRGFPCYRCRSEGVIRSAIGVAPCPICEKWLRSCGWEQPDSVVPCDACKTDHAGNTDSAFWQNGVEMACPTHAVRWQERLLAHAHPKKGPCDECNAPGFGYVTTSGPVELHILCDAHFMDTRLDSLRAIPDPKVDT